MADEAILANPAESGYNQSGLLDSNNHTLGLAVCCMEIRIRRDAPSNSTHLPRFDRNSSSSSGNRTISRVFVRRHLWPMEGPYHHKSGKKPFHYIQTKSNTGVNDSSD